MSTSLQHVCTHYPDEPHLSPDIFVVKGVAKKFRDHYLIWEEGRSLDLVIELTSRSTRDEDLTDKFTLYRDVLKVQEYFLFDPREEYLTPSLQGYRLMKGQYVPIRKVKGRLPSKVLGLHLERDGWELRLFHPCTGERLRTPREEIEKLRRENEQLRRKQ